MRSYADDVAASPAEEWMARVSPFLLANDPHQACIARARAAESPTVGAYCQCPKPGPCQKECCA